MPPALGGMGAAANLKGRVWHPDVGRDTLTLSENWYPAVRVLSGLPMPKGLLVQAPCFVTPLGTTIWTG